MKKIIFSALAIVWTAVSYAQDISYAAATIPAILKEGAHVVTRSEEIKYVVKDLDKASLTVHKVYTILDEEGKSELFFALNTDKTKRVDEVDIRIYDAFGRQINKFKKKDLLKQASQGGLVDEGVYHWISIPATSFPVTIELNYEVDESSTLFYPRYSIQNSELAVESSSFTAVVPADIDLRYREQGISLKPSTTTEGNNKIYKWEVKNLKAYKGEEGGVDGTSTDPAIILGPNKFKYYNTYGDMTSWKSFGQWAYGLLNGLDELPEDRKAFFVSMVKDAKSDKEKVAIIYDYLQKNFRYVLIRLGIGGYKPFPAKFTDQNKYGDCKGLSFFMNSALKAVGIKSYCALINSQYNDEPVPESFPGTYFNHMILCVPQQKDTIWLECTSSTIDFNFLGSGTENRKALLLTEGGGVLVATPSSLSSNNCIFTSTKINLNEDGSGTTVTSLASKGKFKYILNEMVNAKKDDQKEMIMRWLGFKQPDEFTIMKKDKTLDLDLKIEKIPQFSAGSKMFLNPRINPVWKTVLPKSENRKQDYYFDAPFIRTDSTVYSLPEGYIAESLPPVSALKCDYGSYSANYSYDKEKNQLVSITRLELTHNKIPAGKYAEVKKFFDGVLSEDTQKMVIKKN
jgi:hypothetical protein